MTGKEADILTSVVCDKMTFEWDSKGSARVSYADIWERSIPGTQSSQCQRLRGHVLKCPRRREVAGMSGAA